MLNISEESAKKAVSLIGKTCRANELKKWFFVAAVGAACAVKSFSDNDLQTAEQKKRAPNYIVPTDPKTVIESVMTSLNFPNSLLTRSKDKVKKDYLIFPTPEALDTSITISDRIRINYPDISSWQSALNRFSRFKEKNGTIRSINISKEYVSAAFLVNETIGSPAQKNTLSLGATILAIALPESASNGRINNRALHKKTLARGSFQFIPSTGRTYIQKFADTSFSSLFPEAVDIDKHSIKSPEMQMILDGVFYDIDRSTLAAGQFTADNCDGYLKRTNDAHITLQDVYAMHHFGLAGGIKFLEGLKNTPHNYAYTMYDNTTQDGAPIDGKDTIYVQRNYPTFKKWVRAAGNHKRRTLKWRTFAEVAESFEKKGMSREQIVTCTSRDERTMSGITLVFRDETAPKDEQNIASTSNHAPHQLSYSKDVTQNKKAAETSYVSATLN